MYGRDAINWAPTLFVLYMIESTDQLNRTIQLPAPPRRIISLVPSQTELLFDLGLDQEVVGITKFCIHPEQQFRKKTKVGGTKNYHFDRILALRPDLILANKEENDQEQIEQLMQHYPVWLSDVRTLEDALSMIRSVGILVGRPAPAAQLAATIQQEFDRLRSADFKPQRVAYFIWNAPLMVAASNTFIDHLLHWAGFENVFGQKARYPVITETELKEARPERILLSSEPFPFKEKHLLSFKQNCPNAVVELVEGDLFSWYGSRLLQSASYFFKLRQ